MMMRKEGMRRDLREGPQARVSTRLTEGQKIKMEETQDAR